MYKVTMIFNEYTTVDGEYKKVEIKKKGQCATWDDVETFLACQVEAFGSITCEIEEVTF